MSPGVQSKKRLSRKPSINTMSVNAKYNVQHRSDLLMNEHIRNVRQVQYELQSALQELESAKGEEEIKNLRASVAELKTKSEKLVLAFQVMSKINTELTYARNDLNDALHKGIGDINAARKRVIWLEDKMGELCGKKRLKSRRPSNRFVTDRTYGWDTDSDGEQTERRIPLDSAERMYSENARHQTLTQLLGSEIGFTSDSEQLIHRHDGLQDMSYDSQEISASQSNLKGVVSSQEDVSSSGKDCLTGRDAPVISKIADHRKSLHDSITSLTSGGPGEIMEESGSEKFSTVKEASVVDGSPYHYGESTDPEGAPSPAVTVDLKQDTDREGARSNGEETTDQETGIQQLFDAQTPIKIEIERDVESEEEEDQEEEREGEMEQQDQEEEEAEEGIERGEDTPEDEEGEKKKEKGVENGHEEKVKTGGRKESTFMTEVEEKPVDATEVRESTPARDLGAEYWQSEHHRFEYSEFAEVFTEINPLSYHQMGLAVPGSFIQKEDESDFQELPWRARRKGSDIKDIHRIALDKLAARVHGMYDKVYDAAMMSVRASDQTRNLPRETSVFHSLDYELIKPGSSSSKSSGPPPLTAPASIRQKTEDKLPLPTGKEMKRGGTFAAGRLVFYPKPIPPPQVLPITRTSLNKEYPQFASSFSHPDPESRNPAERLVDQRNLLEETKLVLYHEKIKPSTPGPTKLEKKFQKMLDKDRVSSHKAKKHGDENKKKLVKQELRKKVQGGFKAAAVMAKFQGDDKPKEESSPDNKANDATSPGVSSWNQIKPQSRGKEYAGLRWERVKTIVHMNLKSERTEERVDAAKQLGLLRCGDTMVFYALKERLKNDPDERVRYEAAKSLILIGCWEDEVLEVILKYLVLGNTEVRADLIETLIEGKNVQYVDKTIPSFIELVKILSHFCRNPDPDDLIAFDSAVCLGRLCVRDESAEHRLKQAMEESKDNHIRAKALEILVKQLIVVDSNIVSHIQELLKESPVWKYRALACRLLIALGPKSKYMTENFEEIYSLLEKKLWDDPNMEVRLASAKALTALGMFTRACLTVEKKLEDSEEDARAQAAICVGTLGLKSEKLIRLLLEMLELDSSDYVRLMIIRTFGVLTLTDRRVLRCLREREKLEGALGRESGRALKQIEQYMARHPSKSWTGPTTHKNMLHSRRVLSPILASAM